MTTLAEKLGMPVHHSLLLQKAREVGLHDASALIGLGGLARVSTLQGRSRTGAGETAVTGRFLQRGTGRCTALPPPALQPRVRCVWAHRC